MAQIRLRSYSKPIWRRLWERTKYYASTGRYCPFCCAVCQKGSLVLSKYGGKSKKGCSKSIVARSVAQRDEAIISIASPIAEAVSLTEHCGLKPERRDAFMLAYTTIGTRDLPRSQTFYDAVFATLGLTRQPTWTESWVSWGRGSDSDFGFCICPTFDGMVATAGNGTMFAFRADSADQVRSFHSAGLANGGTDEGEPGTREEYGDDFYVAYLRDPDGHKLACVFSDYDGSADHRK